MSQASLHDEDPPLPEAGTAEAGIRTSQGASALVEELVSSLDTGVDATDDTGSRTQRDFSKIYHGYCLLSSSRSQF